MPLSIIAFDYPAEEAATIPHPPDNFPEAAPQSPQSLALAAIGWILQEDDRAARYLELTGLDLDSLRAGLGDPAVLCSALDFLANHEPDLIRAAEALAITPEELIAARQEFSR